MSRGEKYARIIMPDRTMHSFELQSFPPNSLPFSEEKVPQWSAKITQILSQDHLPRQDRWNAVKPYYYGGLSVLIDHHSRETVPLIDKWRLNKQLTRFFFSSNEEKYSLVLTRFKNDCSLNSFTVANRLFPPGRMGYGSLSAKEQRIFKHLNLVNQQLLDSGNPFKLESIAHRIQSGFGTALDHAHPVFRQAPFLWQQAYGRLPSTLELEQLLEQTVHHHLIPLSSTHFAALVAHQVTNQIIKDSPASALLSLYGVGQRTYIDFPESIPRLSYFTLGELEASIHSPDSPRLGCPARLSHQRVSPLNRLFSSIVPQIVAIYADIFAASSSDAGGT